MILCPEKVTNSCPCGSPLRCPQTLRGDNIPAHTMHNRPKFSILFLHLVHIRSRTEEPTQPKTSRPKAGAECFTALPMKALMRKNKCVVFLNQKEGLGVGIRMRPRGQNMSLGPWTKCRLPSLGPQLKDRN